ncbi:MAG: tail fiber protein [Bacteroidota bacterium]
MEGFIGFTTPFAGNFAPKGWAFCQGQSLPITQYMALYSIIGILYGGDGKTNFNLPDLRGRTVIGAGTGMGLSSYITGQKGGTEAAALTLPMMPAHLHMLTANVTPNASASADNSSPVDCVYAPPDNGDQIYGSTATAKMASYPGILTTNDTGNGVPFPNLSPVLALNYIICLTRLFSFPELELYLTCILFYG